MKSTIRFSSPTFFEAWEKRKTGIYGGRIKKIEDGGDKSTRGDLEFY